MISINNMTHSLGKKTVLKNVCLTVNEGTVLGVVGINGAGKSTLLRLLAGVYIADEGEITYDGLSPAHPETRRHIFFLPDDPYYTIHSTPNALFDFYKTFYKNADKQIFDEILSVYSISPNGSVRNFSKGMRRQVFIAIALAIKPKYLLLDEAFDGLDPLARKIFKDRITALVEQTGATVVITSHSLRELEDFCDCFALIDNCTVRSHGSISEHVDRLCKFELAFTHEVTSDLFAHLPAASVNIRGKFVHVIIEGDPELIEKQLEQLSPAVIEQMPIDFEETFLYDVNMNRGVK